jgi:hypothetical protein
LTGAGVAGSTGPSYNCAYNSIIDDVVTYFPGWPNGGVTTGACSVDGMLFH